MTSSPYQNRGEIANLVANSRICHILEFAVQVLEFPVQEILEFAVQKILEILEFAVQEILEFGPPVTSSPIQIGAKLQIW